MIVWKREKKSVTKSFKISKRYDQVEIEILTYTYEKDLPRKNLKRRLQCRRIKTLCSMKSICCIFNNDDRTFFFLLFCC